MPDSREILSLCLGWHFGFTFPGVARSTDKRTAITLAYQDAVAGANALADTFCGTPFGGKRTLIRANFPAQIDDPIFIDGQWEAHLKVDCLYGSCAT